MKDLHHEFFKDYAIREINILLWISLILITSLLLNNLFNLFKLWIKAKKIPGPPSPSFFYGHSNLLSTQNQKLSDFLLKSHEKYGSIVRLWLGPTQLLVSVKDPVIIKEMLVKVQDKLPFTGTVFRRAFGSLTLFISSFHKVKKSREFLVVQLNGKLLERANAIHSKVVECVVERVDSGMTKGVLDCISFSQHMAFTILGATLFGDTFLAWSNATVYEELLMTIANEACFWASYSIPPFWKKGFWRYKCFCTRLKSLTQELIQQCRQSYNLGQMDQNPDRETKNIAKETEMHGSFSSNDVIEDDLVLAKLDDHLNPKEPYGNVVGMMFHGCLTTAGLIANIMTRLVMHPELQNKIYSEIVMVRQRSTKAEMYNVQSMTFLLATVYESARTLPAGPLLQRCSPNHDLNLKTGITVPAGAILVVPVQLVQMDGSSWGTDACQFNPYRFLSNAPIGSDSEPMMPYTGSAEELAGPVEGPFVLNDPNANSAFLPFGSGPRACVGKKFAILVIAKLFAYLLQHYEIKLQPDSENDPKPTMNNCVLQLLPSPKIVLVKREC